MFSHPGKKLRDHLFNVKSLALSLFNSRKTNIDNYTNDDIVKLLEIICLTHDFGKATQYFQDYLDSPNDKNNNNVLKNHSFFSAIWTYIISDKIITNKKLPLLAYFIVLKHHGDFVDFNQAIFPSDNDEIEILKKQLEKFNIEYILNNFSFNIKKNDFIKILEYFNSRQFRKKLREVEFENEDYYLANYLFSLLITSDKGDAIFFGEGEKYFKLEDYKFDKGIVNSNSVDEYKKLKILNKKTSPLNDTREIIYKEAESNIKKYYKENKIFSITAPTGSGKTFTVLNVALKLRELFKNNYKIIYALPFTSIIDQNYEVFKNVFNNPDSSILIKHHSLSEKEYKINNEKFVNYDISNYLISNWDSQIIVTTFVQLLHSILSNKNRSLMKFYNIVNSIVILDEVQAIPYKYWVLIKSVIKKISELFNTFFILTTATTLCAKIDVVLYSLAM